MSVLSTLCIKARAVRFCVKEVVTFYVKTLLQFELKKLLHAASKVVILG